MTGRPTKKAIAKKKKPGKVGRPPGEAAVIAEYKARMLNSPKSRKVLDSILDAALNDEHRHQSAAWKLLMDRMLPLSMFDNKKGGGAKPSVTINISSLGETTIEGSENDAQEVHDAEYEEIVTEEASDETST